MIFSCLFFKCFRRNRALLAVCIRRRMLINVPYVLLGISTIRFVCDTNILYVWFDVYWSDINPWVTEEPRSFLSLDSSKKKLQQNQIIWFEHEMIWSVGWGGVGGSGRGQRPLWLITLFKEPAPPNHLHSSTLQTRSATRDHTSTSPSAIRLPTHESHMQPMRPVWETDSAANTDVTPATERIIN